MDKKRISINIIAQLISLVINIGINLKLTPFITEQVGKEVYGYINLAFQMTGYITILTTALNAMLGRFVTIKVSQKDFKSASMYFTSVTIINMAVSLLLILPTALLILMLEYVIKIPAGFVYDIKMLWGFIGLGFFVGLAFDSFSLATYATNRLDISAKVGIKSNILKLIILTTLYTALVPKVWYFGISYFLCALFIFMSNVRNKKKLLPEVIFNRIYFRWSAVKELFLNGIWNSFNQLSNILISGLDMIITNIFLGATQMALMGFAKAMPVYIIMMISAVASSFSPQLTIIYATGEKKKYLKELRYAMKLNGFLCSIPILGLLCFGADFFDLWLPVLTDKEIRIVQLLSVLTLMQSVIDVHITPLYSVNALLCKLKIPVMVNLVVGLLNVAGTLLLLKYTDLGVFAVQIVSTTFMVSKILFFTPIYAAKILELKWYAFYPNFIKGLLSSVVVILSFILIRNGIDINSWSSFLLSIIIAGITGYIINFIIMFNMDEKRKIVKKVISKIQAQKN